MVVPPPLLPPQPTQTAPAINNAKPAKTSPRFFLNDGIHNRKSAKASVAAAALPGRSHRGPSGLVSGLKNTFAAVVVQVSVAEPEGAAWVSVMGLVFRKEQNGGKDWDVAATLAENETEYGSPAVPMALTVKVPDWPGAAAVNEEATGVIEYTPVTEKVTPEVITVLPFTPNTETTYWPATVVAVVIRDKVTVPPAPRTTEFALSEHGGMLDVGEVTEHVNPTVPVNPFTGATVITDAPVVPAANVTGFVPGARVKVGVGGAATVTPYPADVDAK
jgi:hypothetical protein